MATWADDFSRSGVTAMGANWLLGGKTGDSTAAFAIVSSQAYGSAATTTPGTIWYVNPTAATFGSNHAAEISIAVSSHQDEGGPAVRCSTSGGYAILADITATGTGGAPNCFLRYYYIDGSTSWTASRIGNYLYRGLGGSRIRLEVSGSVLRSYIDGSLAEEVTHSALTTGQPGWAYRRGNTGVTRLDDFSAADLSSLILTSVDADNEVYSGQIDVEVKGDSLSSGMVVTYKGIACTVLSASGATSLKVTFPDFFTNNIKLGEKHEFKVNT